MRKITIASVLLVQLLVMNNVSAASWRDIVPSKKASAANLNTNLSGAFNIEKTSKNIPMSGALDVQMQATPSTVFASAPHTTFTLHVVAAKFKTTTTPFPDINQLKTEIDRYAQYINHVTLGRWKVDYRIVGDRIVELPYNAPSSVTESVCLSSVINTWSKSAFNQLGFNPSSTVSSRSRTMYIQQHITGCPEGFENPAYPFTFGSYHRQGVALDILKHEIGHVLGMSHSGCVPVLCDPTGVYGVGTYYGDYTDPMGVGKGVYSHHNLEHLLPEIKTSRFVTQPGLYTVKGYRINEVNGFPESIKIQVGSDVLWVEMRSKGVYESQWGVQLRWQLARYAPPNLSLPETQEIWNKPKGGSTFKLDDIAVEPISQKIQVKVMSLTDTEAVICLSLNGAPTCEALIKPIYQANGIVNSSSFVSSIAKDSMVSIFGKDLSKNCTQSGSFVTTLCGTQVMINDVPAKLSYVSPSQINFLMPSVAGNVSLKVVSAGTSGNVVSVNVLDSAPGIYTQNSNGTGPASAQHWGNVKHKNGTFITTSAPLEQGNTAVMYVTGLGSYRASLNKKPTIKINNVNIDASKITFADKISDGLDQINITTLDITPLNIGAGTNAYNLQVCTTVCSQTTTIAIKK